MTEPTIDQLNELHLFAGTGGGILGGMLLGHTCVCAVEIEPYCREVLLQRQRDGILPKFPIWDDIRTFNGKPWNGKADVVCGGFPCQKFSNAHHGNPTADDLWPEMFRVVREISPSVVFAENVKEAPILSAKHDLESLGFKCNHGRFDAHFFGAPHSRTRWWIVGYTNLRRESDRAINAETCRVSGLCERIWNETNLSESLRMDDGVANRMDRLKAAGNGQIPEVVRRAWRTLFA